MSYRFLVLWSLIAILPTSLGLKPAQILAKLYENSVETHLDPKETLNLLNQLERHKSSGSIELDNDLRSLIESSVIDESKCQGGNVETNFLLRKKYINYENILLYLSTNSQALMDLCQPIAAKGIEASLKFLKPDTKNNVNRLREITAKDMSMMQRRRTSQYSNDRIKKGVANFLLEMSGTGTRAEIWDLRLGKVLYQVMFNRQVLRHCRSVDAYIEPYVYRYEAFFPHIGWTVHNLALDWILNVKICKQINEMSDEIFEDSFKILKETIARSEPESPSELVEVKTQS